MSDYVTRLKLWLDGGCVGLQPEDVVEPTVHNDSEISDVPPRTELDAPRTVYLHLGNDQCYFCKDKSTNTFYVPSAWEVRSKGPHGEMIAYHVCPKCLGRCQRKISLNHEERVKYIKMLEDRGSVRGRTIEPGAETISQTLSKQRTTTLVHRVMANIDKFVVIGPDDVVCDIKSVRLVDGRIHLYLK